MKVIGINGSSRKDGNTAILIRTVLKNCGRTGLTRSLFSCRNSILLPVKCAKEESVWLAWKEAPVFSHMMIFTSSLRRLKRRMAWCWAPPFMERIYPQNEEFY